jgi:arylsulfatase A-like enzyme
LLLRKLTAESSPFVLWSAAGEHNIWGKHTNFELGTRVPIILRDPDHPGGIVSNLLTESVDLYPTVGASIPAPLAPSYQHHHSHVFITS